MTGENHLQGILDALPSALISINSEMRVIWRNQKARELAPMLEPGVDVWEALGPWANVEKIDRMMLRGERVSFSATPDGPPLEWLVSSERLEDDGFVLMAWDPRLTDEMTQRRSTFVMGASHELRSPLTALVGFAEILALDGDDLDARQAEAVATILQNARYLHSLVEDVIDLSRNSFGELRLDLQPVDANEILASAADSIRPQVEDRDQALELRLEPGLPAVEADPQRVRQVVANLLQNANIHCGEGCRIEAWTEVADGGVVIGVSDSGPGLPFEDPDDAFTSFRRGASTGVDKGSGVGLTISKRLVELHRGRIEVETRAGEGTAFRVWLPLERASALEIGSPGPA